MVCFSALAVILLSMSSYSSASYNGYCTENGNRYTISSNDCKCFHQRDVTNGNEGYHRCPQDPFGDDLVFNTQKCVCDRAADTKCEGSMANVCPPIGQAVGPVGYGVGDGWCIRNGNKYTVSNNDCTCFHQKDLSNGNNGYHRCPAGTKFNTAVCVCDHAYNVKCAGSKTDVCPGKTHIPDDNDIPDGISCTRNGNKYTIRSRDCTCFHQEDMSNGNYGYHVCPAGLTFNPAVCVCDWPYNSKCLAKDILSKDDPQCPGCNRADIVFVVDGSGSIGKDEFKYDVKPFLKTILNNINVGPFNSRVALVQFSSIVKTEFLLTGDKSAILSGIDGMTQMRHTTRTDLGLKRAREVLSPINGGRTDVKQIVFVLTDGKSDYHYKTALSQQANLNHQSGFKTYSVGVGSSSVSSELELIASLPSSKYVQHVSSFSGLSDIARNFNC